MVRIVAGIDDHHENALSFIDRLRFASADVRLLYVIESLMPDKSFPNLGPNHPLSVLMAEIEQQSEAKLAAAAATLAPTGYPLQTELRKGDSARCLIEFASSWAADIIAVGSAQKGQWGSLFFGSVTKALTAGAELAGGAGVFAGGMRQRRPGGSGYRPAACATLHRHAGVDGAGARRREIRLGRHESIHRGQERQRRL